MAVGNEKPHAVCIPSPYQSHVKAMLKLAKLLHHKGFHITFVNTESNHKRLLDANTNIDDDDGDDGLLVDFEFETIPNGLSSPSEDDNVSQDLASLRQSITNSMLPSFLSLLAKLNHRATTAIATPPVSCIVSDGFMTFSITAAEQLRIPVVLFFTLSACGFMGFYQYRNLLKRGLVPLKDESYLTNGYLDTIIDWIPGMKDIRLKDLPSFLRTTNPNHIPFNFAMEATERSSKASAIILHTFDDLEQDLLNSLSSTFPFLYTIGPLQLLLNQISEDNSKLKSIGYSLWKEETGCLQWLNSKEPNSVIYVNFGSITVMTNQQLVEFGWGLANSHHNFLWAIRPDLVIDDSAILPQDFVAETKERGLIASWCAQEQVLNHPSVGGFLTHGEWNSILESLSAGVPMICWPFEGDQQTNCKYICSEWEVGMEIDNDVKRDGLEKMVRELMGGEKGRKMKNKAMEWNKLAAKATTSPNGSSNLNLNKLVNKLLVPMEG